MEKIYITTKARIVSARGVGESDKGNKYEYYDIRTNGYNARVFVDEGQIFNKGDIIDIIITVSENEEQGGIRFNCKIKENV